MMEILLLIVLLLPIVSSLLLLTFNKENSNLLKYFSLGSSLLTFVLSVVILFGFDYSNPNFRFIIDIPWIYQIDAGFRIGLDGMSLLLMMLTTFLTPITVLVSFSAIKEREKEYYFFLLALEFALLGVFISLDLFLFYIFWELVLIPMYFIIGIWGGKNKFYATVKFFIYTVVGSLFMLVAVIWLGAYAGGTVLAMKSGFTTNYIAIADALAKSPIPMDVQKWIFLAFALAFAIKVPLFPLHTWLPDAHTEAPTPGSVILAGVLLKMGTYGLVRFNLQLFPQASAEYAGIIGTLAVIGIIYGALVAMVQTDVKRLIAYSSVSHMGYIVLGIFSMTYAGLQGAILQMVNHGISTGMLFICIGMLYERRHTREISEFGGIIKVMPHFTFFFSMAMFASVGAPGLNGFIGEFLSLLGAYQSPIYNSWTLGIVATTGMIFAAVYLFWMFQRVMYGENSNPANHSLKDISKREFTILIPMLIMMVWIGIQPNNFMKYSEASSKQTIEKVLQLKNIQTTSLQLYKQESK